MNGADMEVLKTIALIVTPFLVTLIGFFAKGALKKNDDKTDELQTTVTQMDKDFIGVKKDIQALADGLSSLRAVREEWYSMKQEVGQVVLEIKSLKSSLEDVVILKRDQATIWKRIDELREDFKERKV